MPSQKDIYNAIARENDTYPYTSSLYFTNIIWWLIKESGFSRLDGELNIAEIGANDGQLATNIESVASRDFSYRGIELSPEAVDNGNTRFIDGESDNWLIEGNILAPSNSVIEVTQSADVLIACYVAPSMGLEMLLNAIDKLMVENQQLIIIDRAYTPEEIEGLNLVQLLQYMKSFIQYHHQNGIPIPWGGLIEGISQKMIYTDSNYQQGFNQYAKNATGTMTEVQELLSDHYGDDIDHLGEIGDTFVLSVNK